MHGKRERQPLSIAISPLSFASVSPLSLSILSPFLFCKKNLGMSKFIKNFVGAYPLYHNHDQLFVVIFSGYLASTSPLFTIFSASSSDSTKGNTTNSAVFSTSLSDSPRLVDSKTAWDANSFHSLPSYESSVKSPIYVI